MNSIILSVVIPCTDRTVGLQRAIASVFAQDFSGPIEVILVENNSTNKKVVENIADSFNSEMLDHYYLADCLNANVARNYGASKASGEFIAFLDSDDELNEVHFSSCLKLIGHDDGVFSAFYSVLDQKFTKVTGIYTSDIVKDLFLAKTIDIRTSVLVFKKSCFDKIKFDESLNKHQDWGLVIDFSKKFTLAYTGVPSVNIYIDGDNRMSAKTNVAASLYFAKNKLPDYAIGSFILTRMSDEITLGELVGLKRYIKIFTSGFSHLSIKKKIVGGVFIAASKSTLIYFGLRMVLQIYKKYFVKNK